MLGSVVVSLRKKEACGSTVAPNALTETATLSHGQKGKALRFGCSANTTWKVSL